MTSSQRWGWGLLTVLATLSILFLLMSRAEAGGYCQQGDKYECGTTTTTTEPSSTTTTSTQEEETTTTTLSPTTTSTEPLVTTTTVPSESTTTTTPGISSTSTLPAPFEAPWTASSNCHLLTAEWGEGIVRVDVWQRIPAGDFGPADGLTPFTTSGQTISTEGAIAGSEWILIPVVLPGYVAVPDQISLFTEHCSPTTTPSELPLTGGNTKVLVAIAAALSTLGFMFVKEAGRE